MDKGSANAAVLACCVCASRNLQSRRDAETLAGGANHRSFAIEDNQPRQGVRLNVAFVNPERFRG